jgi:hypothetical protein
MPVGLAYPSDSKLPRLHAEPRVDVVASTASFERAPLAILEALLCNVLEYFCVALEELAVTGCKI